MTPINHSVAAEHVAFAANLARWIERAGVTDDEAIGDLAVGFADTLAAAAAAGPVLEELLTLDPRTAEGADRALEKLGYLHALLISEAKYHLEDLERRWEILEALLLATAPADATDDEDPKAGV